MIETPDRLKILLVDDSEDDAFLLLRELKKGGADPEYTLVDSEDTMAAALRDGNWDIVITDHNMPGFSSFQALELTKRYSADLPVIIVSGTIGEGVAVSAMKAGAQDYIMKDNLSRLLPAIDREVRESSVRKAKRQAESTLEHMAFHDSLTDLANRREFERRLAQALQDARETGRNHVLLYLDLDQFKVINDTCGHIAGDELLKQLSSLLKNHIRSDDTLARLGGDEFGVLLRGCDALHASRVAESLCEEVGEYRFVWQHKPFSVSLSVGMVVISSEYNTTSELLSHADLACYAAKDRGRNNVQVYQSNDKEMQQRQTDMQWTSRLQQALQSGSFCLCHQEMVALQRRNLDGFRTEFLVRLKQGQEIIPPGAFIPAAERFSLMPKIDRHVIELAFNYLDRTGLGRESAGTFFINLSGSSLSDGELFTYIRRMVDRYNIRPERICFEITETAAIAHLNLTLGFIEQSREEGFKFALDDFGSGMSSFSYLKTLPVDYLKVDGSFVRNMLEDPIDMGIVDACNRIGHAAGLKTIAEFVETEDVKKKLAEIGLDYAQGYGIARPELLNG
ncbi:GGDEF domain-containing response regulator [Marinobacter sp. SS21]|uniref:GGDEF domain-containing response regulator n=1 Tax=Marinobacter sp. SS21 TaxID=2979460 RepID=UPI00233158E2|nr:GGDEF domain-containing response regulator [Marinobacter sp. SS21]MDC0664285.1 EAL domain-containing protein [Marinobacter sp. SS21]